MSDDIELVPLLADFFGSSDFLTSFLWLFGAAASYVVLRLFVVWLINRAMERTATEWDDILAKKGVFRQLAFLAPALVLYFGVGQIPWIEIALGRRIILAYVAIAVVFVLIRLMSAALEIYSRYPISDKRPIKGWVQVGKLVLYVLGAITAVSVLLDKSPWGILGGIGALSAILILVFRDTILSLLASIQLVGNDLIGLNDWIEVPECGADGSVIDISLYTVKVQNWDRTIVAIPTSKLIDGTFPDYERVIPSGNDKTLAVDAKALGSAVDRVATIATEKTRAVKMGLDRDKVTLTVTSPDNGTATEEVPAEYASDGFEIGFNATYLKDILNQIDSDTVEIHLADAGAPTLIRKDENSPALYVLMPMRV